MANKKVSQLTSKPSVLVTDLFPIADPSTGQLYKTTISDLGTAIGSGVSSVNGLVGAVVLDTDDIQELVSPTNKWFTDTRARAALSASSPLTYNSGTGAFGIQVANGSQNGYLSSTDWTNFNGKQAALSGTGFVKISGTTISYDNSTYLTTSAAASTYLALSGGTLTGALIGTSAIFTGDLTISSTNPRIYLTDTDNNTDYFISNTDGTFTVYDVTNSTARFTIGTTGNATFANAITGGGSITGQSIYSNGIVSVGTYLVLPANNTVGGTNYYIGQTMADNDYWRIYGNTVASDQGELVFHLGDNGSSWASVGQRFRFYIDNTSSGTAKSLLTLDYDTATLTTALSGTSATFSGQLAANGGDFRITSGGLSAVGVVLSSNYDIASNPKSVYTSYGQSAILGGHEFRSVNGSGTGLITSAYGNPSGNWIFYYNVGIGVTSPQTQFHINGVMTFSEAGFDTVRLHKIVHGHSDGNSANNYLAFQVSNGSGTTAERMRITGEGNMGIGNGSSYAPYLITLNQTGGGQTIGGIDNSNGASLGLIQFNAGSMLLNARGNGDTNNMLFNTGGSERMRIAVSGGVSIGTTSDTGRKFSVSGTINVHGANNAIQTISKSLASGGTTTFSMNSDYGYGLGDNISGLFVVSISEPTTDVANNSAVYVGTVNNPRGGDATVVQISKTQGPGITSFTVTNSGNSISVSATSSDGSSLKASLTFIGGGGTN